MSLGSLFRFLIYGRDPKLEQRLISERGMDRRHTPRPDVDGSERRLKKAQSSFDEAVAGVVAVNQHYLEKRHAGPST